VNLLNDDSDDEKVVPLNKGTTPRQEPRQEAEAPLTRSEQVILDIRRDIQNFQANAGPRKEIVDALKDQFVATRHQAATKAEVVRMLALDMLRERLPEIKSVSELMRVISTLSKISENDLAAIGGGGVTPGTGALLNIQQSYVSLEPAQHHHQLAALHARSDNPSVNLNRGASHVLESFERLNKVIKERA
jgi:hypothetical protein